MKKRSTIETADGGDMEVIKYWKNRLKNKKPPKWLVERSKSKEQRVPG